MVLIILVEIIQQLLILKQICRLYFLNRQILTLVFSLILEMYGVLITIDTVDQSNELRSSTGLTARWNSPIGPMTFVLSTNLLKADTDVTESFNFNLGTTF